MTANHKPAILIVDDEPDVLFSLTGLLRRDFQVHTAESGAQALDILREHPVQVIMTDQRMPSMTGVELMQRVRTDHPKAIRIVFTGYADIRAVVEAINGGQLYRYITKPWDPDDLVQLLHDAANKYNEVAAQTNVLGDLQGYLDDASRVATAADPVTLGAEFLEEFKSRTDRLRAHLQLIEESQ